MRSGLGIIRLQAEGKTSILFGQKKGCLDRLTRWLEEITTDCIEKSPVDASICCQPCATFTAHLSSCSKVTERHTSMIYISL